MATDRLQLVGGIGGGIKIDSASVGQTIKVKAVDENGKPTEWESADFPESGAKSWDELENRPFYDDLVSLGNTLSWDGTPTDVYVDDGGGGVYAKVSDNTPTKEDLLDGRLTILQNNTESDTYLGNDTLLQDVADVLVVADYAFVVYADNAVLDGIKYPKKGIYFAHGEAGYVKSLQTLAYTFTKGELKKLDKKYLPDDIGVKSWNDLPDKPFDDESVTIEWDGDSTGKVTLDVEGTLYVKVSDLTPEPAELIGGTLALTIGNDTQTGIIVEDMIEDARLEEAPFVMVGTNILLFIIAYEPFNDMGIAEAGMYFLGNEGVQYISSLTYGSIKKLDPKYLPEGGVGYEGVTDIGDTLIYDGEKTDIVVNVSETKFYHVSDSVPTIDELISGTLATGDETAEITEANRFDEHIVFLTIFAVVDTDNYTSEVGIFNGITFPKKGIYATDNDLFTYPYSLHIPNYNFTKTEVHKIDKKFLPDDIGGKCDLPEITDSDNGKFLQVVDGAYALVALTDVSVEGA